MRKQLARLFIVAMVFTSPVMGYFDTGVLQDFEGGLGDWTYETTGAAKESGLNTQDGFVRLGKFSFYSEAESSILYADFIAPVGGTYTIDFDYRFIGYDFNPNKTDVAIAGVSNGNTLMLLSSSLAMNSPHETDWRHYCETLDLDEGQNYTVAFSLNEKDISWGDPLLMTEFHIDNVLVTAPRTVPAPGAVMLGITGLAITGWLRRRSLV